MRHNHPLSGFVPEDSRLNHILTEYGTPLILTKVRITLYNANKVSFVCRWHCDGGYAFYQEEVGEVINVCKQRAHVP